MDPDFLSSSNDNKDNATKHNGLSYVTSDQFESVFDDVLSTGDDPGPVLATTTSSHNNVYLSPSFQSHNNLSVPQSSQHHRSSSMHSDTSSIVHEGLSPAFHSVQASPMFYAQDTQQTTGLEQLTQDFTLLDEGSNSSNTLSVTMNDGIGSHAPSFDIGFQFPEPSSANSPSTPDIGFPLPDTLLGLPKSNERSYDSNLNDRHDFMNMIPFPDATTQATMSSGAGYPSTSGGGIFPNDDADFFSTVSQASVSSVDTGNDSTSFLSPVGAVHHLPSSSSVPGRFRSHSDSSLKKSGLSAESSESGLKSPSLFLSPSTNSTSLVTPILPSSPLPSNGYLSPHLTAANLSSSTLDSNGSSPGSASNNQLSVPGAEVRRARSTSTSSSRSRTSTSRSRSRSQTRDYLLELASPSQPNKRVQKHPSVYGCHLCDKRFTRAYNLRSHLRTHTDERPFVCTVCGKAFARQHDRKRHEALHSGEKKFQCRGFLSDGATEWGCGRKFARADALGRHFRTEAGKECIWPLIEEDEKLKSPGDGSNEVPIYLNDNSSTTPSLMLSPPESGSSSRRGASSFPSVLLQQFPSLSNLSWDNTGSELEDE